jgi:hypothetical protein
MPALSQSLRVKGSREVSVVRDLDLAVLGMHLIGQDNADDEHSRSCESHFVSP